jgi:uncharacterized protein (TIGR00251 family)
VGFLTASSSGVICVVRVTPRAGRTAIAGVRDEVLLVKLAAAPVDGAANEALTALLADVFDVPRRDVTLVSGHHSRLKRVEVRGLTVSDAAARLALRLQA